MKAEFLIPFVTLLLVHTAVSFGAYKLLTTTTREPIPFDSSTKEVTSAEQRARGERAFQLTQQVESISVTVPWSVKFYVVSGYVGLAMAAVVYLVGSSRSLPQ
jgi:hypothetical protein